MNDYEAKKAARIEKSDLPDNAKEIIRHYKPEYSWEPHPFAPYQLSNNNANIKRVEQRVKSLAALAAKREQVEAAAPDGKAAQVFASGDGWEAAEDFELNRVVFRFEGKPPAEIRHQLKRHGFRWSPSNGVWMRHLHNGSRYQAGEIIKLLPEKGGNHASVPGEESAS